MHANSDRRAHGGSSDTASDERLVRVPSLLSSIDLVPVSELEEARLGQGRSPRAVHRVCRRATGLFLGHTSRLTNRIGIEELAQAGSRIRSVRIIQSDDYGCEQELRPSLELGGFQASGGVREPGSLHADSNPRVAAPAMTRGRSHERGGTLSRDSHVKQSRPSSPPGSCGCVW